MSFSAEANCFSISLNGLKPNPIEPSLQHINHIIFNDFHQFPINFPTFHSLHNANQLPPASAGGN
ncbi:MAG: hypothetical protein WCG93_07880 [Paludibacter sp.]